MVCSLCLEQLLQASTVLTKTQGNEAKDVVGSNPLALQTDLVTALASRRAARCLALLQDLITACQVGHCKSLYSPDLACIPGSLSALLPHQKNSWL